MPEFILDHGTPDAAQRFEALDAFTQGYIEAMLIRLTHTAPNARTMGIPEQFRSALLRENTNAPRM